MNKPKDWWGDPANAKEWIEQNKRRTKTDGGNNTTAESTRIVLKEILEREKDFYQILEVGSGDGRLIGELYKILWKKTLETTKNIHKSYPIRCSCVDINKNLLEYINKEYLNCIRTHHGDIIKLPFEDNSFDLVYTYQVLQHIHPEDIEQALKELQRIARKEVWMWEGIGRVDYEHGAKTHGAHNGSWVWHIDKMVDCYEVSIPQNKNIKLDRQRLYKVKK